MVAGIAFYAGGADLINERFQKVGGRQWLLLLLLRPMAACAGSGGRCEHDGLQKLLLRSTGMLIFKNGNSMFSMNW